MNKQENYPNGSIRPEQLFEMFNKLDSFDQERFVEILLNNRETYNLVKLKWTDNFFFS